jgi:hypothetical protein
VFNNLKCWGSNVFKEEFSEIRSIKRLYSVVCIATVYGLEGSGFEIRWAIFSQLSLLTPTSTQPLASGLIGPLSRGGGGAAVA